VPEGASFEGVRRELVRAEVLSPRAPLALWARLRGEDRRVRAGLYELSAALSPLEILRALVAGETLAVRVTLPEGVTRERVFALLGESLEIPADSLRAAAADTAWLSRLGVAAAGLEGYLFPDTYLWSPDAGARELLAELVRACLGRFDAARDERLLEIGMTRHEALTLASIVEAEVRDPLERRRVAAVYHNRLRLGWPLQADPTVAYALGRPGRPLARADLEADLPYNTYRRPGLPPGPICSPGLACIDAVLWPLEGCEDLYFVARGDGTHAFSRSLEEHNRRIRVIRAERTARGAG
ncbi:MAG: endolytic transglycosylase MltG, partial [Armatimonadetes bacterium]|nr:endolytic transglycosylase MltG [Armatimonadota bacterium]